MGVKDNIITPYFEDSTVFCDFINGAVFKGNSVLYKNPENGVFYLILKKENDSESSFNRVCNTLSEYGTRLKGDAAASGAYYAEHYDLIVKKDALKVLQNL